MAKCKLETSTFPPFRNALKKIFRKHHGCDKRFEDLKKIVEEDHLTHKAFADRIRTPGLPHLQGKIFKYDFDATGTAKRGRGSHRLIAMFLDDEVTLHAVQVFERPNNDYVNPREMADLMKNLRLEMEQPSAGDTDDVTLI